MNLAAVDKVWTIQLLIFYWMYDKKKFKLSLALNICVYQKNYFNISFDIGIKLFYEQIYSC